MKVLIEFENRPLLFERPEAIISCSEPAHLSGAFKEIERALKSGFYVSGFLSYEAGYCFEACLRQGKKYDLPLMMMGVYRNPAARGLPEKQSQPFYLRDFRLNIKKTNYASNIERIREYIAQGDVYQITYCLKFHFNFSGDPQSIYAALLKRQPVPYPAYIETDQFQILSLSPERFIKKESGNIITEPMKGTWPRRGNFVSDLWARFRFSRDAKNKAENIMIADLLRNDLGRIGAGIKWPRLFTIAKYSTLFQMTSTVTGKIPRDLPIYDLFAALFPSGSVTGAPKIRAMEIIRGLESEERKIYTGAIGYIAPSRDLYFNVPIRTLLLSGHSGEMGVGGGIVWDSTPEGEWQEGMLKARFLTESLGDADFSG